MSGVVLFMDCMLGLMDMIRDPLELFESCITVPSDDLWSSVSKLRTVSGVLRPAGRKWGSGGCSPTGSTISSEPRRSWMDVGGVASWVPAMTSGYDFEGGYVIVESTDMALLATDGS